MQFVQETGLGLISHDSNLIFGPYNIYTDHIRAYQGFLQLPKI